MDVISKKSWSVPKVFTMERIDIRYALAEEARDKRFVESLQWRSEEIFFAQENLAACVVDGMHTIKTWTCIWLMKWNTWLCLYFLFIVPVVENDLKLSVNHQFIATSLYNQRTQLIFITDIFRPKIKCTTLFGGTLCLCEVSRFLSKLLTDHATAAR